MYLVYVLAEIFISSIFYESYIFFTSFHAAVSTAPSRTHNIARTLRLIEWQFQSTIRTAIPFDMR